MMFAHASEISLAAEWVLVRLPCRARLLRPRRDALWLSPMSSAGLSIAETAGSDSEHILSCTSRFRARVHSPESRTFRGWRSGSAADWPNSGCRSATPCVRSEELRLWCLGHYAQAGRGAWTSWRTEGGLRSRTSAVERYPRDADTCPWGRWPVHRVATRIASYQLSALTAT